MKLTGRRTILIVDGSIDDRFLIAWALKRADPGLSAQSVAGEEEAARKTETNHAQTN